VAAAGHETEVWRLDRIRLQGAGHDMPVKMVDGHERQLPGGRQRLGRRQPHEKRADQAGTARDRHRPDVPQLHPSRLERIRGDRVHQLEMPARGDLGHDPAVAVVQQTL
jgi:hypothetical protein